MDQKRKTTFNLRERTHQGLKFAAASQKREMAELLEEALRAYFEGNKMTRIEKDELALYRIPEGMGVGSAAQTSFQTVCSTLDRPHAVVEQLLEHVNQAKYLNVEVNDGQTGFRNLTTFPNGAKSLYYGGELRLRLTIPGRQRFEQLQTREQWESTGAQLEKWKWIEKASAFRSERVVALEAGRAPVPIAAGPKLLLHCIPLESFGANDSHDVFALNTIVPMYSSRLNGWGPRINVEGKLSVASGELPLAYTQVYRNGAIEAVRTGILSSSLAPGMIPSLSYEEAVVEYVPYCLQLITKLGCTAPVLVGISLIGVAGLTMAGSNGAVIDRDPLLLPEIIIEDLSAKPAPLLKHALDVVWNACGSQTSPYFDEAGNWVGERR